MTPDELDARLRATVGDEHVARDDERVRAHAVDWTGRFRARPRCVVRPGSTEEVADVVRACAAAGVPVTAQGGNTGLVGGAVPVDGGVVLATTRLDGIEAVDADEGTVVAGAGVTLASLVDHVMDAGWAFGVDLASRDTATVGGMIATDAGGARVVANGSMRRQVVGVEAVLADGSIARPWFDGATKDTAGYSLAQLLIGSEGTLAIVTAARLRVVAPSTPAATMLLGVGSAGDVAVLVGRLRQLLPPVAPLVACEVMAADGLALAADGIGTPVPVATPFAVLVEIAGEVDDELLTAVAGLANDGEHDQVVVALDEPDRRRLWALRERHAEVINRLGVPVKLDVAVPMRHFGELLLRAPTVVGDVDDRARTILFGHAAEANCHVNVVLPGEQGRPPPPEVAAAVQDAVLRLVGELGGTVSAEHGIGREKVRHLHLTRDDATIRSMRAIKDALDPTGLLNPGVVLPGHDGHAP